MLKQLSKIGISFALAAMILTAFGFFYSNTPLQYTDPDGATDYRWEGNRFFSQGTEGFSAGFTNNEGYYNLYDRAPDDPVDILIMGSSQLEASNVPMKDATANLLNAALPDDTVYNISVSAHTFLICADHLEAALEKYKPRKYVIIETERAQFTDEELRAALAGQVPALFEGRDGMMEQLRKNPYLTLLARQARNYLSSRAGEDMAWNPELELEEQWIQGDGSSVITGAGNADTERPGGKNDNKRTVPLYSDEPPLGQLLARIAETARKHDVQVIVLYHPPTLFYEAEGSWHLAIDDAPGAAENFRTLCEAHGLQVVDMSERFLTEYEIRHVLPHGFTNTAVGAGHLNKEGHAMIADELLRFITAPE